MSRSTRAGTSSTSPGELATPRGASASAASSRGAASPGVPKAEPTPIAPTPSVRQRRRPTLIVLGATLAALGGLGGAYLAQRGGTPQTALVAAAQIAPGHKIAAEDLKSVQIGTVDGAATVPESQRSQLVGKTVRTTVDAGSLINPATIIASITPGPGSSVIGIAVKAGQYPAIGLKPGDKVHVVVSSTGQTNGQNAAPVTKPGTNWAATVVAVGDLTRDGVRTVDVSLPSSDSLLAATAAGTGALALVLDPAAGQ